MKNIILLSFITLLSCNKKNQPEPILTKPLAVNQTTSKYVEIYITYGGVNNFCSVKWSYVPNIDSGYTSTNSNSRTIRNYTDSDSIYIYTNSYVANQQQSNTVLVVVNGVIKTQYNGIQQERLIKL